MTYKKYVPLMLNRGIKRLFLIDIEMTFMLEV
jgi:hypothetical protein